MNNERLSKLKEYLKNDPNDPFVLYAIANEYLETEPETALHYFEQLLQKQPDYLPTYYMAAQTYAQRGAKEAAESTYKKGIALAQASGDFKTLAELKNAYQNFLYED